MSKPDYFKCIFCYNEINFNFLKIKENFSDNSNKYKPLICDKCEAVYAVDKKSLCKSPQEAADLSLKILNQRNEYLEEQVANIVSQQKANSIIFDQVKEITSAIKLLENNRVRDALNILYEQVKYIEKSCNKDFKESVSTDHLIEEEE